MATHYDIVFEGRLLPNQELATVKQRLITLFRSPEKIEALFTGRRVLVKRAVNEQDAEQYRLAFARAGAVCELVPAGGTSHGSGPSVPAPGTRTAPYSSPPQGPGHATMAYGSPVDGSDVLAPTVPPDQATSPPPHPRVRPPSTAPIAPAPVPLLSPAPPAPQVVAPSRGPAPARLPAANGQESIPDLDGSSRSGTAMKASLGPAAAAGAGAAARAARAGNPGDFDIDDQEECPAFPIELLAPNHLDLDSTAASDAPHAVLEVAQEPFPTATYDLALPVLRRDESGQVFAEPAAAPEPPAPGRHPGQRVAVSPTQTPPHPRAPSDAPRIATGQTEPMGSAKSHAGRTVASAAGATVMRSGRPLRQLETEDDAEHTYVVARGFDSWRFGMTVTAISFLLMTLLTSCSAIGALVRMEVRTFLLGLVPTAIWIGASMALWNALKRLPVDPNTASSADLVSAAKAHAGFWKLWSTISAIGGGLFIVGLIATVGAGHLSTLVSNGGTGTSVTVESWDKTRNSRGYTIELDCSDGTTRSVECSLTPFRSYDCTCSIDGETTGEFSTRTEPRQEDMPHWATDGCNWQLEPGGLANASDEGF
jgi:hypothetical protein